MAKKGRVYAPGATKRERPWSEKRETPAKFRAGVGGPNCPCCGSVSGKNQKRMRRHIIRRREKASLRAEEA